MFALWISVFIHSARLNSHLTSQKSHLLNQLKIRRTTVFKQFAGRKGGKGARLYGPLKTAYFKKAKVALSLKSFLLSNTNTTIKLRVNSFSEQWTAFFLLLFSPKIICQRKKLNQRLKQTVQSMQILGQRLANSLQLLCL